MYKYTNIHTLYRMTDITLEVDAQISPAERLHSLLEQIVRSEVRKLAISLMFPLLEKFNMPIKLV